jgi:hypothetical protein
MSDLESKPLLILLSFVLVFIIFNAYKQSRVVTLVSTPVDNIEEEIEEEIEEQEQEQLYQPILNNFQSYYGGRYHRSRYPLQRL